MTLITYYKDNLFKKSRSISYLNFFSEFKMGRNI